ncbi:MAG: ATP-binding protein [Pseudomonadota bacterium]
MLRLACGESGLHGTAGQALEHARQGVTRLHRALEPLLLLARLEGAATPAPSPRVDALHAARRAIDDASAGLPRVELQAAISAAMLAVPEALLVLRLRNLLDSALRHSPTPGSVALRIEPQAAQVCFCVLDEGPGVTAEESEQATQRFWSRNGGTVEGDAGSGLGLSIVDAVALWRHFAPRAAPGRGLEAQLCFPTALSLDDGS